jgi:hypothetical protein
MPGPPPPPPGPPPPPVPKMSPMKFTPSSSSGGGDNRNALLSQIQKGAKLKKTTTVDKSGPLVAGKIAGEKSSATRPTQSRAPTGSAKTSPDSATSSPSRPIGGFANLTEELQYKMTLKKNKNSPVKEAVTNDFKEVS